MLISCLSARHPAGMKTSRDARSSARPGSFWIHLLASIGLKRAQVYIANVIKCRPPDNRDPLPTEIRNCRP